MTPSQQIDNLIATTPDWRGELYARLRKIILTAVPNITEGFKWGTGVWTKKTNILAIGIFNDKVKMNFFKGVKLKDTKGLINAGLDSKQHRAIDFSEESQIDEVELTALIQEAAELG